MAPNEIVLLRKEAHMKFGAPADIDPAEAILLAIRITYGEVQYFTMMLEDFTEEDIEVQDVRRRSGYSTELGDHSEKVTTSASRINTIIKARQEAVDRLMRYSSKAIELSLDERRVRAAEQWGQLLGKVLKNVLDRLNLTPKQQERAPDIVRAELLQLEATT